MNPFLFFLQAYLEKGIALAIHIMTRIRCGSGSGNGTKQKVVKG
jgi:hypothetical protein